MPSFCTAEQTTPPWYQFELRRGILYAQNYSLMSSRTEIGSRGHIHQWNFYGSIDYYHWELIGKEDTDVLDGNTATSVFSLTPGLYRYFRIVRTDPSEDDICVMSIRQFEVFGTLYESDYVPHHHFHIFKDATCFIKLTYVFILSLIK